MRATSTNGRLPSRLRSSRPVFRSTAKSRIRRAHQLLREQLTALATSPAVLETTLTRLDDWARELRHQLGQAGD